jgi:hypothetical protein
MKRLAAFAFALLCPVLGWAQYNSYTAFTPGTAPSYEGLWWNPSESGWGVSIAHQGDVFFAVWYTYDHDGEPTWFFMPDARLTDDDMGDMMGMMDMSMMGMVKNAPVYTGSLYRSNKVGNRVTVTEVGMATFLFKDRNNAAFAYTVGNVSQSKSITRMEFAQANQECTLGGDNKAASSPNYQDLWWNPHDSGWGVNIAHQGDILFVTYYTYDASGKAVWYAIPNANSSQAPGYTGSAYRGRGPAFDSPAWDASKVTLTDVGQATLSFTSSGAMFKYLIDGGGTLQPMLRMSFATPATSCH